MRLIPAKAVALTLLVASGQLALPNGGITSTVEAAAQFVNGSSAYQAVAPYRLADTRPDQGVGGFSDVTEGVIRVQVAGRGDVPSNASAAVLNVTGVNSTAPGFVTVYPAGTALPTASNINFDHAGQVIANMVTVKLSLGWRRRHLHTTTYGSGRRRVGRLCAGGCTGVGRSGRLVTLPDGAFRAFDTRSRGFAVAAGSVERVDVGRSGSRRRDSSCRQRHRDRDRDRVLDGVSARPVASERQQHQHRHPRPNTGGAGDRAARPAWPAFNVYSQGGGQLIIDVAGYFTGASAAASTDGLFYPTNPFRLIDSRVMFTMPTWGGSTLEVPVYVPSFPVSAVAVNITGTQSMIGGFVTAFPAGVGRPEASNLNFDTWDQTVANHAIVRVSNRGMSLFTLQGLHMIADLSGWYLGPPTVATLPTPTNPMYDPNTAQRLERRRDRSVHRTSAPARISTRSPTSASPPPGTTPPSWPCPATSCCSGTAPHTVRRSCTSTA